MSNALTSACRRYRSQPRLRRELVTLGFALLFALLVLPFAIWIAGQMFLGDYLRDPGDPAVARHGGPLAFLLDYLRGIVSGSLGHWVVLLGPYVLLWAFRVGRRFT